MLALPRVLPVFEANPYLNGFILFVFVVGVLACFWQVLQLIGSVRWIEDRSPATAPVTQAGRAATAGAAGGAAARARAADADRGVLDALDPRLGRHPHRRGARDHALYRQPADLPRAAGHVLRAGDHRAGGGGYHPRPCPARGRGRRRDVRPADERARGSSLAGMGVAFASSLLGLAGSLVVGLLELFAGHGQNRFYRELEEWLSSITRLGFSRARARAARTRGGGAGSRHHGRTDGRPAARLFAQSETARAETTASWAAWPIRSSG